MAQKIATSFYIIWKTPRYLRVLPLSTFRLCETFFSKKFPQRAPLQFFGVFRQNGCWQIPNGPPFQFFGIVRLFFKFVFHQKCPSFIFLWFATEWMNNLNVSPLVRQFGSTFGFFRYRSRKYFDTLKSFCCFWPLDMAPTWAVPGLFFFQTTILTLIGPFFLQFLQS